MVNNADVERSECSALLLSTEKWDAVWRRNQQLASRVPNVVFVEPPAFGFWLRTRRESGVLVVQPPKLLPDKLILGRWLNAALQALSFSVMATAFRVTWVTHPRFLEVAHLLGRPILYDRTDDWPNMETDQREAWRVRRREAALLRKAGAIVLVRPEMTADAAVTEPVVIPNGCDYEQFAGEPDARISGAQARLRVGFAGTVDPFRIDFDILTEIARDPRIEVVTAGPGQPPEGVTHFGILDHEDVPKFLKSCDALIAPYRTEEPSNATADALKLYEYFATGLPVLATATAGFERYPGLVGRLPAPDTVALIESVRETGFERQAIAAAADWSRRAQSMAELICQLGDT